MPVSIISTAPAVKAYLVAAIASVMDQDAAAGDPNVLVSYNEPGNNLPDNVVWLGKVTRTFAPNRFIGSGGQGWGIEKYEIDINLSVLHGAMDPQPCEERGWHVIALIEQAVRADPSCGGRVIVAVPTVSDLETVWAEGEGASGWEASGLVKVAVEASL